jgi:hypothetical protein
MRAAVLELAKNNITVNCSLLEIYVTPKNSRFRKERYQK